MVPPAGELGANKIWSKCSHAPHLGQAFPLYLTFPSLLMLGQCTTDGVHWQPATLFIFLVERSWDALRGGICHQVCFSLHLEGRQDGSIIHHAEQLGEAAFTSVIPAEGDRKRIWHCRLQPEEVTWLPLEILVCLLPQWFGFCLGLLILQPQRKFCRTISPRERRKLIWKVWMWYPCPVHVAELLSNSCCDLMHHVPIRECCHEWWYSLALLRKLFVLHNERCPNCFWVQRRGVSCDECQCVTGIHTEIQAPEALGGNHYPCPSPRRL